MSAKERFGLLQASVDIIRLSHSVSVYKNVEDWLWYFRGWVQWHAIAIVIAELGCNKSQQFVNAAWAVLDPILADWDKVYKAKRDEPAWEHVNTLIERARQMRRQIPPQQQIQPTPTSLQPAFRNLPESQVVPASNVLYPTSMEQTVSAGLNASTQGFDLNQNQFPVSGSVDTPFQTGCAPMMTGFENVDFGYLDSLEDIDFTAFDAVFGDATWDFSSQSSDPTMETFNG